MHIEDLIGALGIAGGVKGELSVVRSG